MIRFFKKPFRWATVFGVFLSLAFAFVLLDTFVIPKAGASAKTTTPTTPVSLTNNSNAAVEQSSDSYQDENIQITIDTVREYDTTLYIADIQLSSIEYLKTAFAQDTYGRNITDITSDIAEEDGAIFAINGDYYGFRNYGLVLRNGILYRDASAKSYTGEALTIDSEGNFHIMDEGETNSQELVDENIWQGFSFGPALIENGELVVDKNSEVSQAKSSNPRTAIGQVSDLHYIFVVSDGRTDDNAGLSLYELAKILSDYGCTTAYNLDGGGSSTMWFNGEIINNPSNKNSSERRVSDIVYIGY